VRISTAAATAIVWALLCLVRPDMSSATTAVLFDVDSGKVLHAENADRPWYPASLTKLLTAYVAFEVLRDTRLTEDAVVRVSGHANAQEPTKLWLKTGAEMHLKTAIGAMIVKSANDAAVMVAEGVGGALARFTRYGACRNGQPATSRGTSPPHPVDLFLARTSGLGAARFDDAEQAWSQCRFEAFMTRMNATAQRLGMHSSHFVNPNGLPASGQVTTARDFAVLARAIIHDFPEYAPLFAARSMRYGGGRLRSYNALLRTFDGANGMKTGFICAAGYNIVASATRNGRRLVAVVLGWSRASDRNARASDLLEFGFAAHATHLGPHDFRLKAMPFSGDGMMPPQDVRASLRSRGCRRGIRRRKREIVVRALDARTVGSVRLTSGSAAPTKLLKAVPVKKPRLRKRPNTRPKPKRVRKKRGARKLRTKKSKTAARQRTATSALTRN